MASVPRQDQEPSGPTPQIAAHDWATTPLGPMAHWPERLRAAADVCAHSGLATALCWGRERTIIHNEAWRTTFGFAAALGWAAPKAFGPLWSEIEPVVKSVEAAGKGEFLREQPLRLGGEADERYWNCSILPLLDGAGAVAGILFQANDVTKTLQAERRLSFQVKLADRLRGIDDPEEVKAAATELLGEYLGAARVGYADVDEAEDRVTVRGDWTRQGAVPSLAGGHATLSSFGKEAVAYLRAGEVIVIDDVEAYPTQDPARRASWDNLGLRALITVPMVRDGALRAMLYVHEPVVRHWTRAEAAMARDVAERTWAAVERAQAEQSLRESEDHYRHAVELNPQVTWTSLPNGVLNRVSSRWEEWTGTSGLAGGWRGGMHPDDWDLTLAGWAHSLETGEPYDVEHRVRRRDGSYRWARSRAFARRDAEGRILLWYGTTEDVHEQKTAEERQRLLINELNHRVKNTLATVQAIAAQTLKGEGSLAEAKARFEARLMALSRAHNLLTEQNWGGASLDRVVRDSVEHLAAEPDRFALAGEPVWIAPRAALALTLALHELGTNAAKYGALSRPAGRVAIAWRAGEGGRLRLEWKETGGPPVAPPTRRGFGSRLIERGLASDLGGSARLDFEPDGLRCTIEGAVAAGPPETELG
jgi:PAS domain S-box-containing protein